jgi:hypothetical protein
MQFRVAALHQLAQMICGDKPSPFPYRSSYFLTQFFTGLGLDHVHGGQSRNPWTRDALEEINRKGAKDSPMPSPGMILVIESLVHPDHFNDAKDKTLDRNAALEQLNSLLKTYLLEVVEDHRTGIPHLKPLGGEYVSTVAEERRVERTITFAPSVFAIPEGTVQDDLVSVMMPFAAEFRPVYAAIGNSCEANDLRCLRADDIWASSTIVQDIFTLIFISRIVIVDFSGKNSNVMYETGIAHTLGKHVIPLTQSMDDVPFDLRSHRVLKYLPNKEGMTKLEEELSKRLLTLVEGQTWEVAKARPAAAPTKPQVSKPDDAIPF